MSYNNRFSKAELDLIKNLRVGRIASVNINDGFPHLVPICYAFDSQAFFTTLHKNSKRLENIENGSKSSLLIDQYEETDGEWIILRGILMNVKISIFEYYNKSTDFMYGWKLLLNKYPQYKNWANDRDLTPKDPDVRRIMQLIPLNKISWGF